MALPTSGPLSMNDIAQELLLSNDFTTPYSLRTLSNYAGFSTPDSISEFYGYSSVSLTWQYSTWASVTGYMYIYANKSLVVSTTTSGSSGTVPASSGTNIDVEVGTDSPSPSFIPISKIYYPSPTIEQASVWFSPATFSFTWDGSMAGIYGESQFI